MIILDYKKKYHKKIIHACVKALKKGKVVVYPTDTSYGLAVDAGNVKAIKKLYKIKERQAIKPVHIIVPSQLHARKISKWDEIATKLVQKFWPGPLTLVLPLRSVGKGPSPSLLLLSAKTKFIGLRYPKNQIALDLAKNLKRPITTTSANPSADKSGGYDSYSVQDIVNQFKNKKYKPDIIINSGKLSRRKPSTVVKIDGKNTTILRPGPISEKMIVSLLSKT